MKQCFKCLLFKELNEFHLQHKMKDGHLNKCKKCVCEAAKARYHNLMNNNPEWVEKELVRQRNKSRLLRSLNKMPYDSYHKATWKQRNPLKVKAQNTIANAIRKGKIAKQPCEKCGVTPAQAHHDDYSKPFDIRWLCVVHHNEHHVLERQKQRKNETPFN